MQYERWAPIYERIRAEFGFAWESERAAAGILAALLPPGGGRRTLERMLRSLQGRDVVVAGLAPGAGAPPVWRLNDRSPAPALVAADGATVACLEAGLVPDVIVTDLDGPVAAEVAASTRGALVLVHAHGDNGPALREWVPQFHGEVLGSWAGPPSDPLLDVGGFTDGDRAAYLAEAAGARRILLWGFDFERVDVVGPGAGRKLRKLAWARAALDHLAMTAPDRLFDWQRDGRIEPYGAGRVAESTQ
ncbi:MAG TPA: 6-hydroxymethylpterin diphosphokinase MptE-like protein [Thermoplasmata archaeon]|nr:6-hydroxymethylpterin diphosphokinase MptE-like protein [Thermoplasmata archaeon]